MAGVTYHLTATARKQAARMQKNATPESQQAVMQAFLGGKIFVDGDASKLLALQAGAPTDVEPLAVEIYREMQAFTA